MSHASEISARKILGVDVVDVKNIEAVGPRALQAVFEGPQDTLEVKGSALTKVILIRTHFCVVMSRLQLKH